MQVHLHRVCDCSCAVLLRAASAGRAELNAQYGAGQPQSACCLACIGVMHIIVARGSHVLADASFLRAERSIRRWTDTKCLFLGLHCRRAHHCGVALMCCACFISFRIHHHNLLTFLSLNPQIPNLPPSHEGDCTCQVMHTLRIVESNSCRHCSHGMAWKRCRARCLHRTHCC